MTEKKKTAWHVPERKREKRKWQKKYPGRRLTWFGGILYFVPERYEVPGAKAIPKDGSEALGLESAFQRKGTRPKAKEDERLSRYSDRLVVEGRSPRVGFF